ncbi:MAG: hypothetical protein ABH817_01280 [archaeon]
MKAIVLFSGGLDSRLALKIMQEQKIPVLAVNYNFPFGSGCCNTDCSFNFTQKQGLKLKVFDCTKGKLFQEYLKVIRNPKFGRGTSMNPCIDCRMFILNHAKKLLKKDDFIVTGEVLNERPMSQHRKALDIVESTLKGRILRPLSAKLLPETIPEKKGIVDRKKLYSINGRSRKIQIELAKKFKIDYPTPAGGCLLCEEVFGSRLKQLFKKKKITPEDIDLLKIGRHFGDIVVGRNHGENLLLRKHKGRKFELKKEPGPTVLLQGTDVKKAKQLLLKYSKHKDTIIEL